jgi:hypothetical protein
VRRLWRLRLRLRLRRLLYLDRTSPDLLGALEAKPHSPVDALISGNACRDAAQAPFFNAGGQGFDTAQRPPIAIPDADLGNG